MMLTTITKIQQYPKQQDWMSCRVGCLVRWYCHPMSKVTSHSKKWCSDLTWQFHIPGLFTSQLQLLELMNLWGDTLKETLGSRLHEQFDDISCCYRSTPKAKVITG